VRLLAALAVAVLAACGGSDAPASPAAAADVRALASHLRSTHPDLHHALPRARFLAARDALARRAPELEREELLVELMRFTALAGVRDGHTGIFPLDPAHREPMHLYPLRLYHFPEGVFVVGQVGERRDLVGKRLVAVGDVPLGEALRRVRPLVPRDNEHSLRARAVQWLVTAEVLHGLGVTHERLRSRFRFADGTEAELAAVPAQRYAASFSDLLHPMIPQGLPLRPSPPFLRHRDRPTWTAVVGGGRAVYAAYNLTMVSTFEVAERVARLARRPEVDRVVLDLRHNPGGDNTTYGALLETLTTLPRRVRLYVLTSRTTFSAAQNLVADLERSARPVFVGEPTGGSPNLYGDPSGRQLPGTGWTAHVATIYWQKSTPRDRRLAVRPHLPVRYTAADFFAGLDPVLSRALAASGT
jgi:hypothetical protein